MCQDRDFGLRLRIAFDLVCLGYVANVAVDSVRWVRLKGIWNWCVVVVGVARVYPLLYVAIVPHSVPESVVSYYYPLGFAATVESEDCYPCRNRSDTSAIVADYPLPC